MKLTTYLHRGISRLGVFVNDTIVNLPQAYVNFQRRIGYSPPFQIDDSFLELAQSYNNGHSEKLPFSIDFPQDMLSFLAGDAVTQEATTLVLDWVKSLPNLQEFPFAQPLANGQLCAPLSNPQKIICVGLNYHDHAQEQGVEVPATPLIFAKFPSTIIGPHTPISWNPRLSQQVDYEAELAVIIGRTAQNIQPEEAYNYIAGYTIINDISARDAQFADGQWVRGKSFDTFCPMGPYLVTADEIDDPHNLNVRCWVNNQLLQDSNTAKMIFKIPELLAYISKSCTLMPGDIISTGTPHGVGVFRDPQIFLKPGDVVEVEIEGVGRLCNTVA